MNSGHLQLRLHVYTFTRSSIKPMVSYNAVHTYDFYALCVVCMNAKGILRTILTTEYKL